jgi:outer membrane protein TolC
MTQREFSVSVVARASVLRQFLDAQMATQHQSLASFAHELELVQESYEFGLATQREVAEAENQLIAAWRGLIEPLSFGSDNSSNIEEVENGMRH